MLRKLLSAAAVAAVAITTVAPSAAMARDGWHDRDRGRHHNGRNWRERDDRRHYGNNYRSDRRYYSDRRYASNRGYYGNRNYYGGRRYRCDDGDGGTVIGAIAGGLLGNQVAGYGDRTAGTIIGAGVGALAGRAIDSNC